MSFLRTITIILFLALALYTAVVVPSHGLNFVLTYFGDLLALDWRGQVNLDFLSYLVLTAFWVAWRHQFSGGGIVLALLVLVGALLLFAPYLLWAISKSNGDMKTLLMGENR